MKRIIMTVMFLLLVSLAFGQTQDTTNGWYFVGASGPIDTAYTYVFDGDYTEGLYSQLFGQDMPKSTSVYWEKDYTSYLAPWGVIYDVKQKYYESSFISTKFTFYIGNQDTLWKLQTNSLSGDTINWYKDIGLLASSVPRGTLINKIKLELGYTSASSGLSEMLFDNLRFIYDKQWPFDSVVVVDRFGDPIENVPPVVIEEIPDITLKEDDGKVSVADLNNVFFDPNDGQLEFIFSSTEEKIGATIDGTILSVNPVPNFFGSGIVTVTASDGEFQVSDVFTVTVTPLDDEPGEFNLLSPTNNAETDSLVIKFKWTSSAEVDGDTMTYQLFILGVDTLETLDTNFVFNGKGILKPETIYVWYVVATDGISARQSNQIFVFKTPKTTGIEDKNKIPLKFSLNQNYPNPFNPTTTISYGIPYRTNVKLEIYNTSGQKVATLVDGEQVAGYYEIRWNAEKLSSGIYFYALKAGKFIEKKKMVLIK